MTTTEIVFGVILLLCAIFLVVAVLMQQGKQKGLSGSISGGADTFFGKEKGKTIDKVLEKATTVIAIIFVIVVLLAFFTDANFKTNTDDAVETSDVVETTDAVETTDVAEDTDAVETTAAEVAGATVEETVEETVAETVAETTAEAVAE